MTTVTLLSGQVVDSSSEEWKAECREVEESARAIRRMAQPLQKHAYEGLAKHKGPEYARRVREANGLTRKLLEDNGMSYAQIRAREDA